MRNIVLLGTAPASMQLAPFGAPEEWEIWACSPGTFGMPRIDKHFELHRWEPGQQWLPDTYVKWLREFPGEVIMSAHEPSVKGCKVLEWERLVKLFGPYFFTSSLAWMMAMAIERRPKKIAFYGVDMASTTEYHDQRMGCQYFAMIARSMGIEVGVPPESDLLRPAPLYGVCENSHAWIKQTARAREMAARVKQAEEDARVATETIHFLKGAMDDQDWQLHSFFGAADSMGQEFTQPAWPEIMQPPKPEVEDPPMTGKAKVVTKKAAPKKRGRPRKK